MGVEQGVGDFRALLQPRRMAAGIAWAGSCGRAPAAPRSACGCRACCAPRRRPGRSAGGCPVVPPCAAAGVPGLPGCAGLQRAARRCSSWAGQEEDATVRAGRLQALAFADAGAGRAGLAEGRGSAHGTIIAGPASRAATLRRPRERASALQRHLALLLQAAEDGVGDLHPLGIGIVAVGQITSPRSRPGTNAT